MLIKQNIKRILLDVDGVICDDREDLPYHLRKPYPWVKETLQKLKNEGYIVILQTARYFHRYNGDLDKINKAGLQELKNWLIEWSIPYDQVYMGKAGADIYIDDRACRINSNEGEDAWKILPKVLKRINRGII